MVFDRRFTADSPRYLAIRSNRQKRSDGIRPPLQDYCVLLTRSFLMVLGGNDAACLSDGSFPGPDDSQERTRCLRAALRMQLIARYSVPPLLCQKTAPWGMAAPVAP